jgi:protein-tyrosine-phosphatase
MGKTTLFVCAGNIFRSQMAKGFYNMYAKDGSHAESCGTRVAELGIGGKLIAELGLKTTLDFMTNEGADISGERSTPISKELVDKSDQVIVMAEKETWPEYLNNNPKVTYWHVPDINVSTMEAVSDTGNKIKSLVKELIKAV